MTEAVHLRPKQQLGFAGTGITLVSAAVGRIMPDLPDFFWIIGLGIGLLLIAISVVPVIHGWLNSHLERSMLLFAWGVIILVLGASIWAAWRAITPKYDIHYKVCFTHVVRYTPEGPRIVSVPIWTQLLQNSGRTVHVHMDGDNSISLNGVSPNPLAAGDVPVRSGARYAAIRNLVEFKSPTPPGEMKGRMSYTLHYGYDAERLNQKMVIKGTLYVNIFPDGRGRAAGFTPDPDSADGFIDSDCQIIKRLNNVVQG